MSLFQKKFFKNKYHYDPATKTFVKNALQNRWFSVRTQQTELNNCGMC